MNLNQELYPAGQGRSKVGVGPDNPESKFSLEPTFVQ
jgi:hypothetical protein